MKSRFLKIAALVLAVALIVGVCAFANSLVGNPISKSLANNAAKKYVEQAYNNTDYELTDVSYDMKDGYYHATVSSPSSVDTHFELLINGFGKVKHDYYEYDVLSGWNTAHRIDKDYRKAVDDFFESNSFPYNAHTGYGELVFVTEEGKSSYNAPDYAITTNNLTIDAYYNANEIGKQSGKLTVYIADEVVSVERMAQILLVIRECFDSAGIGFYAIDCALEYPQEDEDVYKYGKVEVYEFLYSDIYAEGMTERVEAANSAAQIYFGFNEGDFED